MDADGNFVKLEDTQIESRQLGHLGLVTDWFTASTINSRVRDCCSCFCDFDFSEGLREYRGLTRISWKKKLRTIFYMNLTFFRKQCYTN
ncbi:hypothetical protein FACS1894187_08050 [Synergistales bacterium]|nr:hypothetical protein FACS1894187_08050 [Synergistales bacterium]